MNQIDTHTRHPLLTWEPLHDRTDDKVVDDWVRFLMEELGISQHEAILNAWERSILAVAAGAGPDTADFAVYARGRRRIIGMMEER